MTENINNGSNQKNDLLSEIVSESGISLSGIDLLGLDIPLSLSGVDVPLDNFNELDHLLRNDIDDEKTAAVFPSRSITSGGTASVPVTSVGTTSLPVRSVGTTSFPVRSVGTVVSHPAASATLNLSSISNATAALSCIIPKTGNVIRIAGKPSSATARIQPKIIKLEDIVAGSSGNNRPIYIKKSNGAALTKIVQPGAAAIGVVASPHIRKTPQNLINIPPNEKTIKTVVTAGLDGQKKFPVRILPTTIATPRSRQPQQMHYPVINARQIGTRIRAGSAGPMRRVKPGPVAARLVPAGLHPANIRHIRPTSLPRNNVRSPINAVPNTMIQVSNRQQFTGIMQNQLRTPRTPNVNAHLNDPNQFMKVMAGGRARYIPVNTQMNRGLVARRSGNSIRFVNQHGQMLVRGPAAPGHGPVIQARDLYSVVPAGSAQHSGESRNAMKIPLNQNGRNSALMTLPSRQGKNNSQAGTSAAPQGKTKEKSTTQKKKKEEPPPKKIIEVNQEDEDQEDMQHTKTYDEYAPVKLLYGKEHPDRVVETSSLASIYPPDIHFESKLPWNIIAKGRLSNVQMEAIVYANQKHDTILPSGERAGFLIGDGAGVGKGRTIAGIIYENYLRGRKRAIWFSVSSDLMVDALRDLKDISATRVKVQSLTKFKYGKITNPSNNFKKGVIFGTYSSLISESKNKKAKYHTRYSQILHWCGKDFDGVIVFDESHKAKNMVPSAVGRTTKTAQTVLDLQGELPMARVVYASATGASEPRHMAYMSRIGLWGKDSSFPDFGSFIQSVEKRGVGAMELVAMDMKLRGSYIARQLSFFGVSFKTIRVPLDPKFTLLYDECVAVWTYAREMFSKAAALMEAEVSMKKSMWSQFWSAHQRFFKYLIMAGKVNEVVKLCKEALDNGHCCVIGLQSTGEANMNEELIKNDYDLDNFISSATSVFENLVKNHFPACDRANIKNVLGEGYDKFYKEATAAEAAAALMATDEANNGVASKRKRSDADAQAGPSNKVTRYSDYLNGVNNASDDNDDDDDDEDEGRTSDDDNGFIQAFINHSDEDSDTESPKKKPVTKKKRRKKNGYGSDDNSSDDSNDGRNSSEKEADEFIKAANNTKKIKEEIINSTSILSSTPSNQLPGCSPEDKAVQMKRELLSRVKELGKKLPNNVLDDLIDKLGGTEAVAEMTGRKGRIVDTIVNGIKHEKRAEKNIPLNMVNLREKERFMDGEKKIAIISQAASSGISLQSDKRFQNQCQRIHFTIELPWSAEELVQQFGRTHRSNQASAPQYVLLITDLAGEQRFATVVAKRLESLGALTHGDRRASDMRALSRFNFDTKYGRRSLEVIMKVITKQSSTLVPIPEYQGNFLQDVRTACLGVGLITVDKDKKGGYHVDKEHCSLSKFLNRMLGMEVTIQNSLFEYFSKTLRAVIQEARISGTFDQGIVDIGSDDTHVEHLDKTEFELKNSVRVSLHQVSIDRGFAWENAVQLDEQSYGQNSGFYINNVEDNENITVKLAVECRESTSKSFGAFTIYRPNTGQQARCEFIAEILENYRKCTRKEAEKYWSDHFTHSVRMCIHKYRHGKCENSTSVRKCDLAQRLRIFHVLCGSTLSVWKDVEDLLQKQFGNLHKFQVIRFKITSTDGKLVGLLIPEECVKALTDKLTKSVKNGQEKQESNDMLESAVVGSDDESHYIDEDEELDPDEIESSVLQPVYK